MIFLKPIFCSKVAQKGRLSSTLLDPQKVASNAKRFSKVAQHNLDTGIETGLPTIVEIELSLWQRLPKRFSESVWDVNMQTIDSSQQILLGQN